MHVRRHHLVNQAIREQAINDVPGKMKLSSRFSNDVIEPDLRCLSYLERGSPNHLSAPCSAPGSPKRLVNTTGAITSPPYLPPRPQDLNTVHRTMLKKFMQLLLQSYGQRSQRIAGRAPALEEQQVGKSPAMSLMFGWI